jgi:sugar phosphate isomerase/epimerase
MKFAFSSNAFRRFKFNDAVKIIYQAGYHGIEVMADIPHAFPGHLTRHNITEMRQLIRDHQLIVSNVNAFMHHADGNTYHPSWIETDPALRRKRIDYTLACLDLAAELGARNISTEPGGFLEGMTREEGVKVFIEGLMSVSDAAKEIGLKILIEPEPGLLIENSHQFLELMQLLDVEVFGLNFDIGHFFCVGEDPKKLVSNLRTYTHHYHLEDIASSREHYHLLPGQGVIDLSGVLDEISFSGFDGFVTVELYTYEHDPEGAARSALEYLKRLRPELLP